ncbi:MAG: hypothetical protein ACRDMV_10895 [Streptosporangiales bacterium]
MTDEQTREIISRATASGLDRRGHRRMWVALAVLLVCVIGGVAYLSVSLHSASNRIDVLSRQASSNAGAAQTLASQVRSMGGTPKVPAPQQGAAGPRGARGPGPSQQQINQAVAGYLTGHPPEHGKDATPGMVAAAVAGYLTKHPPQPGRPPTQDEISTATASYLDAHPGQFQGTQGAAGPAGKNATTAQVSAAVAAYCGSHGGCAGPAGPVGPSGEQGSQGVSVTDVAFQRDSSGTCQVVVSLHDPATGADSTVTHPAGSAACTGLPLPH